MATTEMNCLASGGGASNFSYNPSWITYQTYLLFKTSDISHFKSEYNSDLSISPDYATYVVGYIDSIPSGNTPFTANNLIDQVQLSVADFNVSKSHTYLVVCSTEAVFGRVYDITVT